MIILTVVHNNFIDLQIVGSTMIDSIWALPSLLLLIF
jgi:hypothetical protein